MGVVQRQSIKASLVAYSGILIGALSTIFLYPAVLSKAEYGLWQTLLSRALLLSTFLLFGAANMVIRYFPRFRSEEQQHHGYLAFLLLIPLVGAALLALVFLPLRSYYESYRAAQEPLLQQYLWIVFPLGLIMALNTILYYYPKNFMRITVPYLYEQVVVKLGQIALVLFFFYQLIRQEWLYAGLLVVFGIPTVGLLLYIRRFGHLRWRVDWSVFTRPLRLELLSFGFFMWIGSFAASIRTNLASAILPDLIGEGGLEETAVFGIAFFIAIAIAIPGRSIEAILSAITAEAVQKERWGEVRDLYQRAAKHQFLIGMLLYGGVVVVANDLFALMPNGEKYLGGIEIIYIIGAASLIDLATGINSQILSLSRYYQWDLWFAIVLGIVQIGLLYHFVGHWEWGIIGAAWAYFISLTVFNLLKLGFLWIRLGMLPFSGKMGLILPLAIGGILLVSWLPLVLPPFWSLLLRGGLFTLLFGAGTLLLGISEDANRLFQQLIAYIRPRSK